MSRQFKIEKDYYCNGDNLYTKGAVTFKPGVTVLVGCNGLGKTTLLHEIEHQLNQSGVHCIKYDNLVDGGANARSRAGFYGEMSFLATSMCSSEGENIVMNIGRVAGRIGRLVKTDPDSKEIWILLDAIDSGLSTDNVVEVKELLFKTILEDIRNEEKDIYIVVSANAYEMARGERCLDVRNLKYRKFRNYEQYRNFILETKKQKEDRESAGKQS